MHYAIHSTYSIRESAIKKLHIATYLDCSVEYFSKVIFKHICVDKLAKYATQISFRITTVLIPRSFSTFKSTVNIATLAYYKSRVNLKSVCV